jgi:dolichol-phosphate mannosyltransferase
MNPTNDAPNTHQSSMLSVIIPCRNEELVIVETVTRLSEALRDAGVPHELLCVNNRSTDSTEAVLAQLSGRFPQVRFVNTPDRPGYGVAVRCGLTHARGDSMVVVMADGSEKPEDVIALHAALGDGFDCAFGDRFGPNSKVEGYPRIKLIFNRLGNWLISVLVRKRYRDFTNGFKCYRRTVVEAMQPLISEHFNLTVEMSISAVLMRARFAVVPNDWRARDAGTSKFKLMRQSSLYVATIAYVLLKYWIGGDSLRQITGTSSGERAV